MDVTKVNGGIVGLDSEVLANVNGLALILFIITNLNFGLVIGLNFNDLHQIGVLTFPVKSKIQQCKPLEPLSGNALREKSL